ncbi:GNAT family N-acetyltransferase [Lolliginicoccus suaedae]|uniref:GNAT family N-acetyltransferase n=1 Tax=Lolliginicoccus suaedae TaxID=2605429 RepID=UPI001659B17C|nr:GNAT family N-acetyltransferase [Lolliginicoccus suaedae]
MTSENASVVEVRTATEEDWPRILQLDNFAFGAHIADLKTGITRDLAPEENVLVAMIDDEIVGVTMHYELQITVPGGALVDAPGVTWVSVAPTHRRKGILRSMLTEQHKRFRASGAPMSILTASEGGIYGRFGYGPITVEYTRTLDRRFARFRDTTADPGGVRLARVDEAREVVPAIYDRWRRTCAGAVRRPDAFWRGVFADPESDRGGASALFYMVHADGFVSYRVRDQGKRMAVEVSDLFAVTPEAYIALWRALCALDLMETITVSEPRTSLLPYLLDNPRLPAITGSFDLLWARILDVPAVLSARAYFSDCDLPFEVVDDFLDQGGVYRLRAAGGGETGECVRVDEEPRVRITAGDLASIYFGEHRADTLAQAGRVWASDEESLDVFDRAFATAATPQGGMFF